MSAAAPPLAIDLCMRLGHPAPAWARALQAVWSWRPQLRPALAHPLVPTEGDHPRPWRDDDLQRLSALLAGDAEGSWQLSGAPGASIYALRGRLQCRLTLTFPAPDDAVAAQLAGAVQTIEASVPAALGMAFDPASEDGELVMSGLHAFGPLAPAVYLDAGAVARLGGWERVAAAPCPTRTIGDGLLLEVRPVSCHDPADPCMARAIAVAEHLGVTAASPISLL